MASPPVPSPGPEVGRRSSDALEAIGFGVLIPVFFVASGMTIDVGASVLLFPVSALAILQRSNQPVPIEIGRPDALEAM